MKKIIVIPLLAFCLMPVFGQSGWPPIGTKWYYSFRPCSNGGCDFVNDYIFFEAIKDTITNDTLCTKIKVECHNAKEAVNYLGDEFFYSAGDKVYNYHHERFNLLYDFSLEVGDTVELLLGSNCNLYGQLEYDQPWFSDTIPVIHYVTKKDSIEINGKKYLYLDLIHVENHNVIDYLYVSYCKIVKGIGSLGFLTGNLFRRVESGFYGPLRCYCDSSVNYTTDVPCDLLTSVETIKSNPKVWVYPNPVTSNSIVVFPNEGNDDAVLEILDAGGRTISTIETCDDHIPISSVNLSNGVFLYRILSDNEVIGSGRFLKN